MPENATPRVSGEYELVYKDRLFVHPDNPRKGNIDLIKKSIQAHGFYDSLVVQKITGYILAGNHRFKAGCELGMDWFPVQWVDCDDIQASEILLMDNKSSDEGKYDPVAMEALLASIKSQRGNLGATGYSDKELDALIRQNQRDKKKDEAPDADMDRADELQEKWKVEKGQIWTAPGCRIACGDMLDDALRTRLLQGELANMAATDPPWNVDYGATRHPSWKQRKIENDDLKEDFGPWIRKVAEVYASSVKEGAPVYLFMSAQEWGTIMDAMGSAFHWSSTIIWAKDQLVLSRKDYHTQYEPIWYGWRKGAPRLVKVEDRSISDLWEFERPHKSEEHPTMKPVPLMQRAVSLSSTPGDLVVDFFSGSGATCCACVLEDRRCACMDLEPKYVSVLLERLSQMGLNCVLE